MESEERSSTGSTVSGVFKTILQSPTPVCMFYFCHPFGVSTPQVRESQSSEKNRMSPYNTYTTRKPYQKDRTERNGFYYDSSQRKKTSNYQTSDNSIRLIPWPRNTWKRDFVLPPLIQFRGRRDDGLAPDLESVLKTIRQAWNTPTGLSSYIQHHHKHDSFWKQFCNQDYVNKMGTGTNQTTTCTRLLKRRYSVPEIIMRKHELAQQRPYDDFNTESVPSPKIPPSTSNSTSSLSRNMFTMSPGSDGNLSRGPEKEISLRKSSLLRQMWEKESRLRYGKASSLRLSSQKGFSAEGGDSHCEECKRLNISREIDDVEPLSSKYFLSGKLKQIKKTPSAETSSSMTDISQSNSQVSTQESLSSKQGQYTATEIYGQGIQKSDVVLPDNQKSENTQEENVSVELSSNAPEEKQLEESSAVDNDTDSGDSALDVFISQMLIENLRDLAEEARTEPQTEPDKSESSGTINAVTTPCTFEVGSNEETGKQTTNTEESLQECTESTNQSDSQIDLDEIPSTEVVQINAGSTYQRYQDEGSLIVVPRILKALPRTESVEVQPSSASIIEEDNYCQNSDESLSLVDSLDDPVAVEGNDEMSSPSSTKEDQDLKSGDQHQKEKSQAFFVPIVDSGQGTMENLPVVAETMPEKLKERIEQRQLELDAKKECYKKIQHQMEESITGKFERDVGRDIKPKTKKNLVPIDSRSKAKTSRDSKEMLRNDIGLLESYTVDSKGNLQFRPPQKTKSKSTNLNKNKVVKKQSIVTTRPPKLPVKSSNSSSSRSRKSKSSPKDVQKMTIFQTQSDIITPDEENGPRRIYQKTEIQDGEKRIEILEIVECVESPEETSPVRQIRPKSIAKSACIRRSRIPVPVCKIGRSAGYQRPSRYRESAQIFGRLSPRDIQGSISPKVDQAIAELLIGALNRSDQAVIEVIRSPKEILGPRLSRGQIMSRRNTPKRSASSGKYRQIFEVIPEEKSSSLSMDSSNEESSKDAKDSKTITSTGVNVSGSLTSCSNTTKAMITTTRTSTSSPLVRTPSRGREAVESIEPRAWIGFFKCHDSSQDDEEDLTQPYPSSTTENSRQHTITSPSTTTAIQGSSTPKNTSSATYPDSTESDNILKVVEKSISGAEKTNFDDNSSISTPVRAERSAGSRSQKHSGSIIQVKECKNTNINIGPEVKRGMIEKVPHPTCQESGNVDVWRVQSPDICKRAIPKSKNCSVFEKCPLETTETEIDSRSFIICSDDSIFHPSDQVDSSTTLNDLHGPVDCRKNLLNMCATCCFCNPDLHNTKSINSEYCLYCNRKKTPQKKEEETNTESDYFKKQDVYQSTSIKDHTHTMSRDSDSVSTKCTRTNEKIKRYMPDSSRASNSESCEKANKKNINRPKNVNNLPKSERKSVKKIIQDDVVGSASQKKTDGIENKFGPFPSPYKNFSSYGYDRSSSSTSSSGSTCPTTPEKRMLFPKVKCRANKNRARKSKATTAKDTKVEETAENKGPAVPGNGTNTGWTVTLAGSCSQGPPPDVEMRLSFPKDQSTTSKNLAIGRSEANNDIPQPISGGEIPQEYVFDSNGNPRRSSLLPPAVNIDSRRALPNNTTGGGLQKDLIFPEVGANTPRNQLVPRHLTKKAIRHLECNVAVTSATRTVSNFTRGRRTMSYQALNADPQKLSSRERQIRDSSLDLGFLSSRRLSFESQSPLESMALSIMGNAIAPEQKPRVPTMSEKDLTRRHNRCFTRNRAFFT